MHFTVMGANGFIGRSLAKALYDDGADVFMPERNDPALFERELGHLFYCVGMTADFASDPSATIEAHSSLLTRLIDRSRFKRIIYLSSTRLYDGLHTPIGNGDCKIQIDPSNPRSLYSLTKALGENLCHTRLPGKSCIARLSGVFDWAEGAPGFLSQCFQTAARKQAFTLDCKSGTVRDYIHLDDVVASLRALMDSEVCGSVNVASGENISNEDIVATFNAHGWSIECREQSEPEALPICDVKELVRLGRKPRVVRDIIRCWARRQKS